MTHCAWLRRRMRSPSPPAEQGIVNAAVRGKGRATEILARHGGVSVQRENMRTLKPRVWLNDEVINFFLQICLAKRDKKLCVEQPGRKRAHFFCTLFLQALFDKKNKDERLWGRYCYKNVQRWGRKVPGKDIFNLKYVVCPININAVHWTCAVIFVEEKRIQYYDSMGCAGRTKLEGLLQYLKDEHLATKGAELDVGEWTLVACTADTPRQNNRTCSRDRGCVADCVCAVVSSRAGSRRSLLAE